MWTNINVQILTAEAAITKIREHIYHAALLDPLTGANLTIDEIYKMVDELLIAHQNFLPKYNWTCYFCYSTQSHNLPSCYVTDTLIKKALCSKVRG